MRSHNSRVLCRNGALADDLSSRQTAAAWVCFCKRGSVLYSRHRPHDWRGKLRRLLYPNSTSTKSNQPYEKPTPLPLLGLCDTPHTICALHKDELKETRHCGPTTADLASNSQRRRRSILICRTPGFDVLFSSRIGDQRTAIFSLLVVMSLTGSEGRIERQRQEALFRTRPSHLLRRCNRDHRYVSLERRNSTATLASRQRFPKWNAGNILLKHEVKV